MEDIKHTYNIDDYFDESDVELDNKNVDFYLCDEDESNKIFLNKKQSLALAKYILKTFKNG